MKKVSFDDYIYVKYVSLIEKDLWYSDKDYVIFLKKHLREVKKLIDRGANLKDATRLLCQTKITFDEDNFIQ